MKYLYDNNPLYMETKGLQETTKSMKLLWFKKRQKIQIAPSKKMKLMQLTFYKQR